MISLFFLGIFLVCAAWNWYFSHWWHKGVYVFLNFVQDHVYAGEQAQMTERIENRKRMMLPILEVAFRVRKELIFTDFENTNVSDYTYKRDIFALLGNQRITRTLTLDCTKRGYYRIEQSDLTTYSLLHRQRFSRECTADTELYVYAGRTDVSEIMSECVRMMGNVQCTRMLCEDPFAYASIREYTSADPMKTVNWKASAKTGKLMVNTFESTRMEKVMLYLDVEDKGILKYEDVIEESISVAASLAGRMLCRGMEVGICVNAAGRSGLWPREEKAGPGKEERVKLQEEEKGKPQREEKGKQQKEEKSKPQEEENEKLQEEEKGKTQEENEKLQEEEKGKTQEEEKREQQREEKGKLRQGRKAKLGEKRSTSPEEKEPQQEDGIRRHKGAYAGNKTYMKPAGGRQQLAKIERMLAGCRPEEGTQAFASILGQPEEDAFIIIISKNAEENREAIGNFIGRERQGIWVIPFQGAEEPEIRAPGNIRIIRREVERS